MTVSVHSLHKEQVVQDHLIDSLVAGEGYELRDPKANYDCALAMDKALVLRFVQDTQSEEWDKLVGALHGFGRGHLLQAAGEGAEGSRTARRAAAGHQDRSGDQVLALLFPARERAGAEACR